jgi:L-rhamnose mutarotase
LHLEREAKKGARRFTIVGLEGGYILNPLVSRYDEMPELEKVLKDYGVSNYSIFLHPETRELFGYAHI